MKHMTTRSTLGLVMAILSATLVNATPPGTFSAAEYEAAKAKAKEEGKPIAIVTTELKSNCPKCVAGNEAVIKAMKRDYVLVIEEDKDKGKIPAQVKQRTFPIYKSKGNITPIVAVMSHTDETLLSGLCYKQISADGRKAFTTLKAEVDAALAKQAEAQPAAAEQPKPAEDKPDPTGGGMRDWVNAEGKTIKAEALSRTETSVTLKLENGKVVDYPLDKLSEGSRQYALDSLDEE
jgi:hypothetical protein